VQNKANYSGLQKSGQYLAFIRALPIFTGSHKRPRLTQYLPFVSSLLTSQTLLQKNSELGQRLMQSASDLMLGWTKSQKGLYFYVRQLRDMKFSLDVTIMNPFQLSRYAEICGWTLARAHARSGDASMISGYLGKTDVFDRAIGTFAGLYAYQAEHDCEMFLEAIKSGEIPADYEK
jgi:hypothetical protein